MYFCDKSKLRYLGAVKLQPLPSLLSELNVGMSQPFPPFYQQALHPQEKYASAQN